MKFWLEYWKFSGVKEKTPFWKTCIGVIIFCDFRVLNKIYFLRIQILQKRINLRKKNL